MRVKIKPTTNKEAWYYNYAGSVVDVKYDSDYHEYIVNDAHILFPTAFDDDKEDDYTEALYILAKDFDVTDLPITVIFKGKTVGGTVDEPKTKVPMFIMLNICTDELIRLYDYNYLLTLEEAKDYLNTHTENMSSIKLIEVAREFNASVDFKENLYEETI